MIRSSFVRIGAGGEWIIEGWPDRLVTQGSERPSKLQIGEYLVRNFEMAVKIEFSNSTDE